MIKMVKDVLNKEDLWDAAPKYTEYKLDYKKMVREIDKYVSNNFCEEMEYRTLSKHEISQEEAKKMADILASIFKISHCCWCTSCSEKYRIKKVKK